MIKHYSAFHLIAYSDLYLPLLPSLLIINFLNYSKAYLKEDYYLMMLNKFRVIKSAMLPPNKDLFILFII